MTTEPILFNGDLKQDAPYAWMSISSPSPIKMTHACIGNPLGEYEYETAVQAIMHIKAVLMGDEETAAAIIAQGAAPKECKRLGRSVSPWNEELWQQHVCNVAYAVLMAKFTQDELLRVHLISTGYALLVQTDPRDTQWAVGLTDNKAKASQRWRGKNLLGNTLMRVRIAL